MKAQTKELLKRLRQTDWFASVGQPLDDPALLRVRSWSDAVKSCRSQSWVNAIQDVANDLRENLFAADPSLCRNWNRPVRSVRPTVQKLVEAKFSAEALKDLPSVVRSHTTWILLHACLAQEHADLSPPPACSELCEWYFRGRLPCGYKGKFPNGRLVVY
jgi:hypothetical protein